MKLYFAGSEGCVPELKHLGVKNTLVAFSAARVNVIRVLKAFDDVLLDSGAFSAKQSGNPINLNDYMSFIRNNNVESYIQLDVIGDDEATDYNLDIMFSNGLSPIPVWHASSTIDRLERLMAKYKRICVGGVASSAVKSSKKGISKRLDTVFAVAKDYWPRHIHGLGVQQKWALERYPFYSVDATTWHNGARFGTIIDSKTHIQTSGMKAMPGHLLEKQVREKHDFAVYGVAHHEDSFIRMKANINATLALESHITNLWASRGIVF